LPLTNGKRKAWKCLTSANRCLTNELDVIESVKVVSDDDVHGLDLVGP